ncbi:hypothetical protein BS78_01G360800 [Paspalum vaginatum]|nr:hypothetical protein BS78_01G360800 [Paspalum vaginatum]
MDGCRSPAPGTTYGVRLPRFPKPTTHTSAGLRVGQRPHFCGFFPLVSVSGFWSLWPLALSIQPVLHLACAAYFFALLAPPLPDSFQFVAEAAGDFSPVVLQ